MLSFVYRYPIHEITQLNNKIISFHDFFSNFINNGILLPAAQASIPYLTCSFSFYLLGMINLADFHFGRFCLFTLSNLAKYFFLHIIYFPAAWGLVVI